jgi:hypothetical protein
MKAGDHSSRYIDSESQPRTADREPLLLIDNYYVYTRVIDLKNLHGIFWFER